jgi:hypothetical protein
MANYINPIFEVALPEKPIFEITIPNKPIFEVIVNASIKGDD